jgi:hypothetical protein
MNETTRRPRTGTNTTASRDRSQDAQTRRQWLIEKPGSNGSDSGRRLSRPPLTATADRRALTHEATVVALAPGVDATIRKAELTPLGAITRDALEHALRDVRPTPIGVVGQRAPAVAEWLRQTGREAEAVKVPEKGDARQKPSARSAARRAAIVAIDCVEHAPDPVECLRGLKRLLSPNGRLILVVPNATHASVRLAMLRGRYLPYSAGSAAAGRPLTVTDVERLLNEAAFTITGVERQIDRGDVLAEIGRGVPEPVLDMLARDDDAMTSHFAFVAEPHDASPVALHRRLREVADAQRAAGRERERLGERIAVLEGRLENRAGDSEVGAEQSELKAATTRAVTEIERIDEHVRGISERLAAAAATESERNAELSQACEALRTRVGEMRALITRLERARYRRLILRIRQIVNRDVPRGATVAVVSRGDEELLRFDRRRGWHFPQTEAGVYAGYYPTDSKEAIAHVEGLRRRGARYLVVPQTAFWWLDHYRDFSEYLLRSYRCVIRDDRTCLLFALDGGRSSR